MAYPAEAISSVSRLCFECFLAASEGAAPDGMLVPSVSCALFHNLPSCVGNVWKKTLLANQREFAIAS